MISKPRKDGKKATLQISLQATGHYAWYGRDEEGYWRKVLTTTVGAPGPVMLATWAYDGKPLIGTGRPVRITFQKAVEILAKYLPNPGDIVREYADTMGNAQLSEYEDQAV